MGLLVPTAVAAAALGVKPGAIRVLRHRGKLTRHGTRQRALVDLDELDRLDLRRRGEPDPTGATMTDDDQPDPGDTDGGGASLDIGGQTAELDVLAAENMQASLVEKLDAGAGLVYAIYHVHGAGLEWLKVAPGPVHRALGRAQAAYGVVRPSAHGRPVSADRPPPGGGS